METLAWVWFFFLALSAFVGIAERVGRNKLIAAQRYKNGVDYVLDVIDEYGKEAATHLWEDCDPSFDNHPFDKGMADELTRQGIKHPCDPGK